MAQLAMMFILYASCAVVAFVLLWIAWDMVDRVWDRMRGYPQPGDMYRNGQLHAMIEGRLWPGAWMATVRCGDQRPRREVLTADRLREWERAGRLVP